MITLLALQVPGAFLMTVVTQRMPRSQAEASVRWLGNSAFSGLPVMVHPYQVAPAVSGYLGRPVYCPATGAQESFCRWQQQPFRLERDALLEALAHTPFPRAVLIADDATLAERPIPHMRITPLLDLTGAQITSEEHHLYLVGTTEDRSGAP